MNHIPLMMIKEEEMNEIAMLIRNCTKCSLYKTKTNVVVGEGSIDANIMFIGEPNQHEMHLNAEIYSSGNLFWQDSTSIVVGITPSDEGNINQVKQNHTDFGCHSFYKEPDMAIPNCALFYIRQSRNSDRKVLPSLDVDKVFPVQQELLNLKFL